MAGELEEVLLRTMDGLAKGDVSAFVADLSDEAQGIDEISRAWLRGGTAAKDYASGLATMVSDVHTDVNDPHETTWGDTGLLTCWIEQDYTLEGERAHVSAPTTVVFRREGGTWKIVLFHSIPLTDD